MLRRTRFIQSLKDCMLLPIHIYSTFLVYFDPFVFNLQFRTKKLSRGYVFYNKLEILFYYITRKNWCSDFYELKLLEIALEPSVIKLLPICLDCKIKFLRLELFVLSKRILHSRWSIIFFVHYFSSICQRAFIKKWCMAQRSLTFIFDLW